VINTKKKEQPPAPVDPAVVAAIAAAVVAWHPGARVTRIEAE
jgi:hypothetical protein